MIQIHSGRINLHILIVSRTPIIPLKYTPRNFNYYLVRVNYINNIGYIETIIFDNKKKTYDLLIFLLSLFYVRRYF